LVGERGFEKKRQARGSLGLSSARCGCGWVPFPCGHVFVYHFFCNMLLFRLLLPNVKRQYKRIYLLVLIPINIHIHILLL
jgi:hypothetical protein